MCEATEATDDLMSRKEYATMEEVPFDEGDTVMIGDTEAEVEQISLNQNKAVLESNRAEDQYNPRKSATRQVPIELCEPAA